jgi:hypothetical protein
LAKAHPALLAGYISNRLHMYYNVGGKVVDWNGYKFSCEPVQPTNTPSGFWQVVADGLGALDFSSFGTQSPPQIHNVHPYLGLEPIGQSVT